MKTTFNGSHLLIISDVYSALSPQETSLNLLGFPTFTSYDRSESIDISTYILTAKVQLKPA